MQNEFFFSALSEFYRGIMLNSKEPAMYNFMGTVFFHFDYCITKRPAIYIRKIMKTFSPEKIKIKQTKKGENHFSLKL